MTTIEERVVQMKFDGNQFIAGSNSAIKQIDAMNNKLKMAEGTKGLTAVGQAAEQQSTKFNRLADNVQHITDRFKAMGVVATTAMATIANQAVVAGQQLIKSLTVEPIMQGFREYETNMNSIQTILANTQSAGTTLKDVTRALDELNHYSDQTIYNFSEMAKNIGTFTAAGVGLKPATAAIKGIANLAALSGSNSEQASGAMYQLSQAISTGRVSLEDWNSVVNAGMGGTVFQRALALTAQKMGTLSSNSVKLKGDMKNVTIAGKSFRESITAKPGQESWLTSDVLTKTLSQFTGDLKDAELAAMGFNAQEIKAIQQQARTAKNAATQVKTVTQLMNTLKESAGSGWAQTWKLIFGDFEEAKVLFTNINNVLGGMISQSADTRNKMLSDWDKMGGRKAIIDALGNSFKFLVDILKPVGQAYRSAFPATTGKQLADFSKSIRDFTESLTVSGTTANNLRRTFAGVFAVLGIGWDILKQVIGLIARLTDSMFRGSGGFLEFTASVGDFLVNLRKTIQDGKGLENLFKGIGDILEQPIILVQKFGDFLGKVFAPLKGDETLEKLAAVSKKLEPLGNLGDTIAVGWVKVMKILGKIQLFFLKFGWDIGDTISRISKAFVGLFDMDMETLFTAINAGSLATIATLLAKFFGVIGDGGIGGIVDNLGDAVENLSGSLGAMQNTLRATTLLQIALAVGILAVSMNVLSKVDAGGLTAAGVAITALFTDLLAAMLIYEKISSFTGFAKMPFVALSMILLATSINILASAMTKIAELDWNEIAKGLTGTTVLIASLVATMQLMPRSGKFVAAAVGTILLATAIKILTSAVKDIAMLSWEEMSRGLIGVAALLGALSLFARFTSVGIKGAVSGVVIFLLAKAIETLAHSLGEAAKLSWENLGRGLAVTAAGLGLISASLKLLPPSTLLSATAIFIAASALTLINDAFMKSGNMSWEEIGKGMTVLAGSLALLAVGLAAMSEGIFGAAALIVAAQALAILTPQLIKMGEMSWEDIGKSMVALGGSMLILSIGLAAMTGSVGGSAALLIAAAALAIFTPVLLTLSSLSWGELAVGLAALAGVFLILGVAGAVLTPVVPTLFALGLALIEISAAMALAGVAIALFGAGVFLFAAGFGLLAASGVAGATALVAMLGVILGAVPLIVRIIGDLLVALLNVVIDAVPLITKAGVAIMDALLDGIQKIGPKLITTVFELLDVLLKKGVTYIPKFVDYGYLILTGVLNGIAKRIGGVITAATNVVIAFINGISNNLPRVIQAGVNFILNFINGLANAIRANSERMGRAGANLGLAIIQGMVQGIAGGIGLITEKASEVARAALNAAKSVLGIASPSKEFEKIGKYVNEGFVKGLDGDRTDIVNAFKKLSSDINVLYKNAAADVRNLQADLTKLQKARKKDTKEIKETQKALAQARKERNAAAKTRDYIRALQDERLTLARLANQYDTLGAKLKAAQQKYEDAVKTRDDYNKSISDQYGDAASPTGEQNVPDYITDLQKQVELTKDFANKIQLLRKKGLNDETYKDLLATGTSALPFVTELLNGGQAQIDQINAMNKELDSLGASMGKTASTALYQAAVDSAAGLVKGLELQQRNIEKVMDKIAASMVTAIKKRLGIKSPSRVFAELGEYTTKGLTEGLREGSPAVAKVASALGDRVVEATKISLSNLDKMTLAGIDVQPVIRPTLDLTDVRNNSSKLAALMPAGAAMSVSATYASANETASDIRNSYDRSDDSDFAATGSSISYVQNNYSPKALSSVEIYRGTKNQLSTLKKGA